MSAASNDQSKAHLGNYFTQSLKDRDPELYASMQDELDRQQHEIELIASENIVSQAVLEAQGSVLTINTPKDIPASVIMAGASMLTSLSSSRLIGLASFLIAALLMCSQFR